MKAYHYDQNYIYIGEVTRQPSPLEKGHFLMPADCTDIAPIIPEGQRARWNPEGQVWGYEAILTEKSEVDETSHDSNIIVSNVEEFKNYLRDKSLGVQNKLRVENTNDEEVKTMINRINNYPTVYECVEALLENLEGNPILLENILQQRENVKKAYPKPS